jgi:hypothetical protein
MKDEKIHRAFSIELPFILAPSSFIPVAYVPAFFLSSGKNQVSSRLCTK